MIPTNIKTDATSQPSGVRPVAPVTPVTAIPDSHQSTPDFTQGQKYQAIVGTRLANGNTRVLVAGQLLQIPLPENIPSGNKVELVLLTREPQLKFLLQNLNTDKSPANISATGRFLGLLAQDTTKTPTSQPLTSTTPILPDPPVNSVPLPALLQKALSQSGLFYESHQAQWLIGKKTLAQLKQEPQGKLAGASGATQVSPDLDLPAHTKSLPLVQQQLSAIETGHLTWRGQIWPGQPIEWDISEHPSKDNKQPAEEKPTRWKTQLRLTLPKLGEVTINIALDSDDVRIKLHTSATKTAELLKNQQLPLATALSSAGLNVQTVKVNTDANF